MLALILYQGTCEADQLAAFDCDRRVLASDDMTGSEDESALVRKRRREGHKKPTAQLQLPHLHTAKRRRHTAVTQRRFRRRSSSQRWFVHRNFACSLRRTASNAHLCTYAHAHETLSALVGHNQVAAVIAPLVRAVPPAAEPFGVGKAEPTDETRSSRRRCAFWHAGSRERRSRNELPQGTRWQGSCHASERNCVLLTSRTPARACA